jgi:hypothetical protein
MRLADQIRAVADRAPREQTYRLLALAVDADRLEAALDHIVEEAVADALALAEIRAAGHG